ncbi:uncharacterized protein LOC129770088 [Toxorhynchites rutilus septentrionalis]|uniref:uncharacterized protein LOC129770088 n=1 Tax=Toxorhynchites rutilus septentrionalis TaxID=329112 RepID=UPI00247A7C23|nr:uncharacterized protein LOC129770088 [Toxorhynchites rutilus septentrionalis]
MAKVQTFRFVGHIYATLIIVVAVFEAIRCLGYFGSEYENNTVLALKSIFALFCLAFAIMLMIGIEKEKIEYIIVYRIFVIFRSICGLVYMFINSLIVIVDHANTASTGKAVVGVLLLIVAIAICVGVFAFELWILEGIKRHVEQPTEVVKIPSVTPV